MHGDFRLRCLGQPELRGPDGKVIRFRVKKHLGLLVYLAVERRVAHDRGRLAEMFWPRAAGRRGRHSLATALSLLRAIFGREAFPASRSAVRFAPTALALDLDRLEAGNVLGGPGEEPLEVDGFLRGFDLSDAPEFGLWKDREQARRLPAIHAALLTLIDHGRRRGAHDEIMARAERLLALDHLAEEGVRATMEALVLAGDRFSALRVFDEWKARLAEELDAEPSGLLEGMASQLRKRGWEPRMPIAMPPVPAEQWRDRKFVGRAAEYRRLYETWETTHQFRPRHVFIVGDSGVGKTTLAQRLVTAAGLEGASVARVQCYQLEQRLPYAAVGGLVSGLLNRPGVAATSPESLAEVAQVVPQVKAQFPGLPPPKPSEGETARLLFAEGVMDLFGAVMDERPLLLVLDDFHLADEASLAVMHLILRRLDRGRYMVVLTARPHDEGETAQARRIREGMSRLSIEPLALEPMSEEETTELLGVILGDGQDRPRPPERRALVRASRGYPMALELLTQDWRSHGPRSLALSLGAMTPDFGAEGVARVDAYSAVAERVLLTLSHNARQVVTLGALLGGRLGDLSLFGLVDLSFGQTVEGVSELTAKRILRSVGSTLEFINELVRAHVYRQIPGAVRTALHAAIADRLLMLEQAEHLVPGLEIAWHLMRSGRVREATPRLFRGASEAKARGAPDEAVLAMESALPQLDPASQTRGRVVLADLHQELGRWVDSLQVLAEVGDVPDGLRRSYQVLELNARWNLGQLDTQAQHEAIALLQHIIQFDDAAASNGFLLLARLAKDTADRGLMRRVLAAAPPPLPAYGDPLAILVGRALLHFHLRETVAATTLATQAHGAISADGRADAAAARLLMGLGVLKATDGRYEESLRLAGAAIAIARRLDNDTLLGQIHTNLASSLLRLRRYNDSVHAATIAVLRLPSARVSGFLLKALQIRALAYALLGRPHEATESLALGTDLVPAVPARWYQQDWLLGQADIHWALNQKADAERSARKATDGEFAEPGDIGLTGQHVRWMARLAVNDGQPLRAEARLTHLIGQITSLDALDAVEVAATYTWFMEVTGATATEEAANLLCAALGRLDPDVRLHLSDLGVLRSI